MTLTVCLFCLFWADGFLSLSETELYPLLSKGLKLINHWAVDFCGEKGPRLIAHFGKEPKIVLLLRFLFPDHTTQQDLIITSKISWANLQQIHCFVMVPDIQGPPYKILRMFLYLLFFLSYLVWLSKVSLPLFCRCFNSFHLRFVYGLC